ncbi:unnamed protein product [Cyprideis torosa]|uniref:Cyanophycinase n=1 Tax=Cyprideis torosa TaxID=163714 RepID=A0A7R8WRM5_9CRUS|nr:unnamed protein product [Cyprideis torosa]CAG0908856.1 unnamed protein product [Cyprideis torosa]
MVVIPTASQLDDTGDNYCALFMDLGAASAVSLPIDERSDAQREDYLQSIEDATGIFITGGNQLRLSTILGGTPVARLIRRRNAAGVCVAGTSAGAAIMPEHMIAGGAPGALPTAGDVTLAPGLGLIKKAILDQHFSERNRLGRLLTAVSFNPYAVAFGIDEDTAVFIDHNNELEVVGSGTVTVVDPGELQYSSMAEAGHGEALTLIGLRLHMLSNGDYYNINTRVATASHGRQSRIID